MNWRSGAFGKSHAILAVCSLTGLGLMITGCASRKDAARREASFLHVVTPQPPPFLTGPTALFLTNWPSFSSRLDVQGSGAGETSSSGQLLGSGSKLIYAPLAGENTDLPRQPGGFSFIWDVAQGRGYVLSEALQAYAPVSAELRITNFELVAGTGPMQRHSGHSCEPATAIIKTVDGETVFDLLRATDLRGFPFRIQARGNAGPVVLNFSDVRFEPVAANVFMPPDGFTLYPNPQAMADELAARQHNFRRKSTGAPLPEMEPRRY
jgi:hypothetical protein